MERPRRQAGRTNARREVVIVQAPPAHPRPRLVTGPANDRSATPIDPGPPRAVATTAPPRQRRKLSPRLRKTLVAAHVLVGVGWFGVVVAKLVLELVALTTRDQ